MDQPRTQGGADMHKISKEAAAAFLCGKRFEDGDTCVQPHYNNSVLLVLCGCEVASIDANGFFSTCISNARQNSQTVRDRLNAVWKLATGNGKLRYSAKNGFLFFDGNPIAYGSKPAYDPLNKAVTIYTGVGRPGPEVA